MALAPAIMLNRRYHWVPSSISSMAATSSPPGRPKTQEEQDRKEGGGRQRGRDLHHRLQPGSQARVAADGDPHRDGPPQGNEQGRNHPEQGDQRAQGDVAPLFPGGESRASWPPGSCHRAPPGSQPPTGAYQIQRRWRLGLLHGHRGRVGTGQPFIQPLPAAAATPMCSGNATSRELRKAS